MPIKSFKFKTLKMNFLDKEIEKYALRHSSPESPLMYRINRETHLEVLQPRMLSGHLQGNFLSMISKMMQPKRILEIGTYTGYSALALAEGLPSDGLLYTIDNNEELFSRVRSYFDAHEKGKQIHSILGNALEVIPTLSQTWDLVFIDADKLNYSAYFDLVFPRVRKGGFIIADNVLWSGKVLDEKINDKDTAAVRNFNKKIAENPALFKLLLPIRDGLMLVQVL